MGKRPRELHIRLIDYNIARGAHLAQVHGCEAD